MLVVPHRYQLYKYTKVNGSKFEQEKIFSPFLSNIHDDDVYLCLSTVVENFSTSVLRYLDIAFMKTNRKTGYSERFLIAGIY